MMIMFDDGDDDNDVDDADNDDDVWLSCTIVMYDAGIGFWCITVLYDDDV